jgi:hypothetical protein
MKVIGLLGKESLLLLVEVAEKNPTPTYNRIPFAALGQSLY